MKIRLPPYASELAAARRQGLLPDRRAVDLVLDGWEKTGEYSAGGERVCIPAGEDLEQYELWFLAGLHVVVWWRSSRTAPDRLRQLLRLVLAVDPAQLLACDWNAVSGGQWQFIKTIKNGTEVDP